MAHGRGFKYEEKVQKALEPRPGSKVGAKGRGGQRAGMHGVPKQNKKKKKTTRYACGTKLNPCLTKTGEKPAGSGSDKPDLVFWFPHLPGEGLAKGYYGVELKLAAASGGSLVIHYNHKNDKWVYGKVEEDEEEKQELVNLAEELTVLNTLNSSRGWGGNKPAPWNTTQKSPSASKADKEEWIEYMIDSGTSQQDRYDIDYSHFPEIKFPFQATAMERYYNLKKCHYIQVGDRGLFLLGSKDPLNLNHNLTPKIPRWSASATTVLRVRCQYKSSMISEPNKDMDDKNRNKRSTSSGYQFVLDVSFNVKKSPYNIGPLKPGKNESGAVFPLTSSQWKFPQTLLDLGAGGQIP